MDRYDLPYASKVGMEEIASRNEETDSGGGRADGREQSMIRSSRETQERAAGGAFLQDSLLASTYDFTGKDTGYLPKSHEAVWKRQSVCYRAWPSWIPRQGRTGLSGQPCRVSAIAAASHLKMWATCTKHRRHTDECNNGCFAHLSVTWCSGVHKGNSKTSLSSWNNKSILHWAV